MMETVWHEEWDLNPAQRWWAPWRPRLVRVKREYLIDRSMGRAALVRHYPPVHINCRCAIKEN